jgi:hypothetical protein
MQKSNTDARADKMYAGDRRWAVLAVAVLWSTYAFVFWKVLPNAGSPEVIYVLGFAGAVVLLFNTASIFSMLKHYGDDKDHIYGLDLHYLDAMRAAKA